MRALPALAYIAVLAALTASSLVPAAAGPTHSPAIVPAPAAVPGAPLAGASPTAALPLAPATPTVSSTPAAGCSSPTPTGTPLWASTDFFADALVTFTVPGSPQLDGANFQTVPCNNVIPTYTNGFWMNVTTNVPLIAANVTIWGTGWPSPGQPAPDIPNFGPEAPVRVMPMHINAPYYHTASFFFNVYRFFWPGSQVYFNITLAASGATPPVIRSTQSTHSVPIYFPGGQNNATWEFYVADPWGAGTLQQDDADFSQVIQVTTTPSVLTSPAFDPNPKQALDVTITAVNPIGGPVTPIPMALCYFQLTGGQVGAATFQVYFGPSNHTTMHLALPIGPYPGSKVSFNVTAWLPWSLSTSGQVGSIDRIYSPTYTFNWTSQGGWWYPTYGLLGNLELSSLPDVTSGGAATTALATGTPVNVTIHSPIENVTISTASIAFRYSDANGVSSGTISMNAATDNTSYANLPGLPPGSTLVFSITAKDVFGNPVASGNYTYTEKGAPASPLPGGYGLFFAEGLDLSTGTLIPAINFTIANSTWSEKGVGNTLGFLAPVPLGGVGYLAVALGSYTVTLSAYGVHQTYTFNVAGSDPFTVVFYFASKPIPTSSTINLASTVTIPAIIGIAGATLTSVPVVKWFRERRKKAEAEQRRISL